MKLSLQKLIDNLREEDKISVVTYRDTVICVAEGLNGKDKDKLKEIVSALKANGGTKGNTAIQFSLKLALKKLYRGRKQPDHSFHRRKISYHEKIIRSGQKL